VEKDREKMPRLAIVEPVVCAGGVERFVHGMLQGAVEEGLLEQWQIVMIRNRYNTAGIHVPLPERLRVPGITVEYIEKKGAVARTLERLCGFRRMLGLGIMLRNIAQRIRSTGPLWWRAYSGEDRGIVENYLRSHRFDLVYYPYPDFIRPPKIGLAIVATLHDLTFKNVPSSNAKHQRDFDSRIREWLKVCTVVPVPSQFVADDLKKFYPSDGEKGRVIRHGIPSAGRMPTVEEVEEVRVRKSLPDRFVLIAGWLMEHKNHHVVFEAIGKLRQRGVHMPLVCVGPDSERLKRDGAPTRGATYLAKIRSVCKAAGLQCDIDYIPLGYVSDLEMACLFRSATMLVVPSITEAFSLPASEAMSASCPVIFSRVPPFEEFMRLVENNAWTFPVSDSHALADVIAQVVGEPEEARRRAQEAMRIAPQVFSWRRSAREHFDIFGKVAGLNGVR
jgi:glycosyltransferase involved in cell wall biosynthesis